MVILATPPYFRPLHLEAAVKANKHVFMEKPVATDPAGIRSIIKSAELAKKKKLGIVAGTQRRHQAHYIELMKRVHGGKLGDIVSGQCYWNSGGMLQWGPDNDPSWAEMERQCRRWYFYTWICGDHIVEQHVHNIDVINWAIGDHPVECLGMGGRQTRTAPEYGNIFDHFAVEYLYPNGARVLSMCRHADGASNQVAERLVGTKGTTYSTGSFAEMFGANPYKYEGQSPNPYVQEHTDLIESIRNGSPLNEGKQVAQSTLTAIMGRMSAYTGRALKWDWVMNSSKLDLTPPVFDLSADIPIPEVAIPGKTMLI
jgi:predicted dehydrogenase